MGKWPNPDYVDEEEELELLFQKKKAEAIENCNLLQEGEEMLSGGRYFSHASKVDDAIIWIQGLFDISDKELG